MNRMYQRQRDLDLYEILTVTSARRTRKVLFIWKQQTEKAQNQCKLNKLYAWWIRYAIEKRKANKFLVPLISY